MVLSKSRFDNSQGQSGQKQQYSHGPSEQNTTKIRDYREKIQLKPGTIGTKNNYDSELFCRKLVIRDHRDKNNWNHRPSGKTSIIRDYRDKTTIITDYWDKTTIITDYRDKKQLSLGTIDTKPTGIRNPRGNNYYNQGLSRQKQM